MNDIEIILNVPCTFFLAQTYNENLLESVILKKYPAFVH